MELGTSARTVAGLVDTFISKSWAQETAVASVTISDYAMRVNR